MTLDTVGPWRVRAEWDDTISRNGPVRVVIEPDPNAPPSELAGGISSTVLRKVRLNRPVTVQDTRRAETRLRKLAQRREVTSTYLAALAEVYALLTAQDRGSGVSHELAEIADRAPSTIKAQLGEARRQGLLTPAVPHRPGGELTEKARALLDG